MTRIASAAIRILACVTLVVPTVLAAQGKPYSEVIPSGSSVEQGLFDVHRVGTSLFFEVPDSLLGREMIIMSRYAQVQDGFSQVGANMAPNIVVRWERRGDHVQLRATSHQTTADSGTARWLAVQHQNFAPVLQSFPIAATARASSTSPTCTPASIPRSRCSAASARSSASAATSATAAGWSSPAASPPMWRCASRRRTAPTRRRATLVAARCRTR